MPLGMKRIFQTPLNTVDTKDKEGVGTNRREGGNVYKYVKYTGAAAAAVGEVLCYTPSPGGFSLNTVTRTISGSTIAAGVAMGAFTQNTWGWIQVVGIATLAINAQSGANGQGIAIGGADGTVAVQAATTRSVGQMLDATAGANKMYCDFPL